MPTSWLCIPPTSDFSLANLPFGIVSTLADDTPRVAVAIGAYILDLKALSSLVDLTPLFTAHQLPIPLPILTSTFSQPTLNAFASLGRPIHRIVRAALQELLSADTNHGSLLRDNESAKAKALVPQTDVKMHLPMQIGDYTDFYAGIHHARAVGTLFRGAANALQPNYVHLPVGYHGRSSSIIVSGTPVRRPVGQILPGLGQPPITAASRKLDFELELGCFVAKGNEMGLRMSVDQADEDGVFGYVLLNDWSARDVQSWEYVPLGPFNGKNFATTVGGWVVLADALEDVRVPGPEREEGWGEVQGYLRGGGRSMWGLDLDLEVELGAPNGTTTTITRTNARHLIWSFPQMMAHHTVGGCPLRTGDLLGSGTISGPGGPTEAGSLLEITENGKKELVLQDGEKRTFLQDGDTVTFKGYAVTKDGQRIGFGECTGTVLPALEL